MGALQSTVNFLMGRPPAMRLAAARDLATPTVIEAKPESKTTRPVPIGGAGTRIWSGFLDDLDPSKEVRGDKWYGNGSILGIADQMLRDPHVRAAVSYITDPVGSAVWDFEPASDSPLDIEIADFCCWMFLERLDWYEVIEKILRYNVHGVSLFEVTDDVRDVPARFKQHPGAGRGIVPTGFHQRMPSTVQRWHQSADDPTKLASIQQYLPGSDVEAPGHRIIPADRLLRWTWEQDGADFAGLAPLRSCYGAWKTKKLLIVIEGMRHERQSLGIPTMTEPENPSDDDLQKAAKALEAMRAHEAGYLLLPNGYTFEWSTTAAGTGTNIRETIEACNRDIAVNFKAGFMLLGQVSQNGSYALANTQEGNYQNGLDKHARFVCRIINRGSDGWSPVERYVRLNYGPQAELPTLVARNMPTRDWSKISTALVALADKQLITPDDGLEDYLREAFVIPGRDVATQRLPKPAPALAAPTAPKPDQGQNAGPPADGGQA